MVFLKFVKLALQYLDMSWNVLWYKDTVRAEDRFHTLLCNYLCSTDLEPLTLGIGLDLQRFLPIPAILWTYAYYHAFFFSLFSVREKTWLPLSSSSLFSWCEFWSSCNLLIDRSFKPQVGTFTGKSYAIQPSIDNWLADSIIFLVSQCAKADRALCSILAFTTLPSAFSWPRTVHTNLLWRGNEDKLWVGNIKRYVLYKNEAITLGRGKLWFESLTAVFWLAWVELRNSVSSVN